MALVPVRVRDCACPDTPHADDGDIVYLSPTLSAEGGIAAEQDMATAAGDSEVLTRKWLLTFLRYGAVEANFLDPFDVDDLLADWALARPVAMQAAEMYQESVIAPFQARPAKRSPTGPTRATTSVRRSRTPSPSA